MRISLGNVLHLACFSSNKWHADASWVCRLKGILFDVRLPQHFFLNQSSSGIVRLVFMHKITHFLFLLKTFSPCANPTDLTPAGKVTPHWVLWTVWPRRSFCCSCWVKQSLMHRCLLFKVRNIDERLLRTGHCMWLHVYPHFSMSGMGRCWSFWELKFQYYEIQLLWFLATADL